MSAVSLIRIIEKLIDETTLEVKFLRNISSGEDKKTYFLIFLFLCRKTKVGLLQPEPQTILGHRDVASSNTLALNDKECSELLIFLRTLIPGRVRLSNAV